MAVSACVSGPVFNLLVGLGLSLVVLSARDFPQQVPGVNLDRYSGTAATLLLFVLGVEMLWLHAFQPREALGAWRLTRRLSFFLLGAYAAYIIVVLILAVV